MLKFPHKNANFNLFKGLSLHTNLYEILLKCESYLITKY